MKRIPRHRTKSRGTTTGAGKGKTVVPSRTCSSPEKGRTAGATSSAPPHEPDFREVLALIERSRSRAFQSVNTELIDRVAWLVIKGDQV